jgi:hypothetical protein
LTLNGFPIPWDEIYPKRRPTMAKKSKPKAKPTKKPDDKKKMPPWAKK